MSELTEEQIERIVDELGFDQGDCLNCDNIGVIFLCSDGWICEPCYRMLGNVPDDVGDELHEHINLNDGVAREWHINIQAQLDGEEDEDLIGV